MLREPLVYDPEEIYKAFVNTMSADHEPHPVFATTRELTRNQRRLFDILADGETHDVPSLLKHLGIAYYSRSRLPTAMYRLRVALAGEYQVLMTFNGYKLERVGKLAIARQHRTR